MRNARHRCSFTRSFQNMKKIFKNFFPSCMNDKNLVVYQFWSFFSKIRPNIVLSFRYVILGVLEVSNLKSQKKFSIGAFFTVMSKLHIFTIFGHKTAQIAITRSSSLKWVADLISARQRGLETHFQILKKLFFCMTEICIQNFLES